MASRRKIPEPNAWNQAGTDLKAAIDQALSTVREHFRFTRSESAKLLREVVAHDWATSFVDFTPYPPGSDLLQRPERQIHIQRQRDVRFLQSLIELKKRISEPKWKDKSPHERLRIVRQHFPPVGEETAQMLAVIQAALLLPKERVSLTIRRELNELLGFVKQRTLRPEYVMQCRGLEGRPRILTEDEKRQLVDAYNRLVYILREEPTPVRVLDAIKRLFPESGPPERRFPRCSHNEIVRKTLEIIADHPKSAKRAARAACALAFSVSDSKVQKIIERPP